MFLNAILLLQSRLIFDYNELLAIYIYYIVEWVVYIFVFCFLSLFSFAAMHRDEWGFVRNCVTHNGNWHSIALNACETIFDQFLPHIYLLIFVPGYMWNMFRIYLYCCSVVSFNLCGSAACHWGGEKEREIANVGRSKSQWFRACSFGCRCCVSDANRAEEKSVGFQFTVDIICSREPHAKLICENTAYFR